MATYIGVDVDKKSLQLYFSSIAADVLNNQQGYDKIISYCLKYYKEVSDVIIFEQTGAYGFTESIPFFLCHNLAGEAVIKNNKLEIVRSPVGAELWLK